MESTVGIGFISKATELEFEHLPLVLYITECFPGVDDFNNIVTYASFTTNPEEIAVNKPHFVPKIVGVGCD